MLANSRVIHMDRQLQTSFIDSKSDWTRRAVEQQVPLNSTQDLERLCRLPRQLDIQQRYQTPVQGLHGA